MFHSGMTGYIYIYEFKQQGKFEAANNGDKLYDLYWQIHDAVSVFLNFAKFYCLILNKILVLKLHTVTGSGVHTTV
jgi:hypothetical protein